MRKIEKIGLGIGLALWIWLVWRAGPSLLLHYLVRVGSWLVVLLGITAVCNGIRAVACRWAMGEDRARFSLPTMYVVLLISEAIKFVAFAGLVFGESFKGLLLSKRVTAARAGSSVVLDVLLYQVSAALFLLMGTILLAWRGPVSPELRRLLWIVVVLVGVALGIVTAGFARQWRTTRRLIAGVARFGHRSASVASWLGRHQHGFAEASEQFAQFHERHTRLFYGILLFDISSHFMSAFAVLVAMRALGLSAGYGEAVAVEALTKLVRIGNFVIPANIGVFEGGTALILVALGSTVSAGVALGIVRQLVSFLWTGLGFLVGIWQRHQE